MQQRLVKFEILQWADGALSGYIPRFDDLDFVHLTSDFLDRDYRERCLAS